VSTVVNRVLLDSTYEGAKNESGRLTGSPNDCASAPRSDGNRYVETVDTGPAFTTAPLAYAHRNNRRGFSSTRNN